MSRIMANGEDGYISPADRRRDLVQRLRWCGHEDPLIYMRSRKWIDDLTAWHFIGRPKPEPDDAA